MKKLLLALLVLAPLFVHAQSMRPVAVPNFWAGGADPGVCVVGGYYYRTDLGTMGICGLDGHTFIPAAIRSYTVANLPASPSGRMLVVVTDANGSCSSGGGTSSFLCQWDGSMWVSVSGGGATGSSYVYAALFAGSDCGAKINAAFASLSNPASVRVTQGCGLTISTAVTVGQYRGLIFEQGAIWSVSATITLSTGSAYLTGAGSGSAWETGQAPTVLQQANGSNLTSIIHVTGQNSYIANIEIDGNKANNASASDAIWIDAARNVEVYSTWVLNAKRYGVYAKSSATLANDAALPRLNKAIITGSGSDGAHFEDLTDGYIVGPNEFELNGGYGVNLLNAPGCRIEASDFAQNTSGEIILQGTNAHLGSSETLIVGNQFGNPFNVPINVQGWNGTGYASTNNTISSNHIFSSSNTPNNTYPAILLQDTRLNSVVGNSINSSGSNQFTAGIFQFNSAGHSSIDGIAGNAYNGTYGAIAALTPFGTNCANTDGTCYSPTIQASISVNSPAYLVNGLSDQVFVTSDFTTSGSGTALEAITGLTWTFPVTTAMNAPFECHIIYHQNTAAAAVAFGFQDATVAPTQINANAAMQTAATTLAYANLVASSTTTATAIISATPSVITTNWQANLWGYIEQPSNASTSIFTMRVSTATAADTVTVKRGSWCRLGI